ncbi:DUF402 domain-containing protein [Saxibacter everestensis]|uniref:DUF402 domain-containing protein n=1 Tax=Saxibacter everestensis TaxID=2909229 RepID=A0ABY8QSZ6_9MICO|nr:DUF402 domain-containing protein [Brevibacteriaceae bacterium ZFBP1038]
MENNRTPRWNSGDQISWVYRDPAFPDLVDLRPVTVVDDTDDHLAVYLESGTRMLCQVLSDGHDIRSLPGPERFSAPRAQAVRRWTGGGILAVFQPNTMYSVWCFETRPGIRNLYYVNIELPFTRDVDGIETSDLVLDVIVRPDRSFHYKDEDELELARHAGMYSDSQIASIREAASDAAQTVRRWAFPFNAGFENFRPDPTWQIPELPNSSKWQLDLDPITT